MRLIVRILGTELLDINLSDGPPEATPDRDLSGGTLGSDRIGYHATVEGEDE